MTLTPTPRFHTVLRGAAVVAVAGSLLGASITPAHAENPTLSTVEAASSAVSGSLPADVAISMPETGNEVTTDILNLGYEQRITLDGAKVNISEPAARGGITRPESFTTQIDVGWPNNGVPFYNTPLIAKAGLPGNRIAVAPGHQSIYVTDARVNGIDGAGSNVYRYDINGDLLASYHFDDKPTVITT
jgi:hypothetical protein